MSWRPILYALLTVAACARLLLQMAALPPYAGLDEVYHVARLAFVLQEGRSPDIRENSIPLYLASTMSEDPNRMADFADLGSRWPQIVRTRAVLVDHRLTPSDTRRYVRTNIEAQQPPLYYAIVGRAGRLLTERTQMSELRFWRLLSVLFALAIVLATARIGEAFFGTRGIAAAALLVSLPTWLTLVVRTSNDAFACALLAVAMAITATNPRRMPAIAVEAAVWALALAAKLYTWPAFVVAPLFWMRQRASGARMTSVVGVSAISVVITVADLSARTHNPLGILAFDSAVKTATPQPIRLFEMIKITIASGIWTSGQHWNALTLWGMIAFAVPLVALVIFGLVRSASHKVLIIPLIAVLTFAAAQVVHAVGYIRRARAVGLELPAAGKEGWFWYALAPLVVAILFPLTSLPLLACWLVGWDVLIHEGALFHDFAGTTSPASPSWLFRWGPLHAPFTADLSQVAVGPFVSQLMTLRIFHVVAVAALLAAEAVARRRDR
jgi:anti-sigma-K factor RskA